ACLQQQSLFPGQYGSLECNQEELPASFAWTWAPPPGKEKPATPRPRSSAAEPAPEAPDPGE
ncbi:MAG: hypothetical protein ABI193_25630, partial [Minicystis sp.]